MRALFLSLSAVAIMSILQACSPSDQLVDKWVHEEKAITLKFFASGDVAIFAPCLPEIEGGSGTYQFLNQDSIKIENGNFTQIYSYAKDKSQFKIFTDSKASILSGTYFTETEYEGRNKKASSLRKSELRYSYTEKKVGEDYEFIGVADDLGWSGFKLGGGAVQNRFHGCVGGFPLLDGTPIFDKKDGFYKDTYTSVYNSVADQTLYYVEKNDIDYGTLDFRFVFDGFDNEASLLAQSQFMQKHSRGCRYHYDTPIVYQGKRKTNLIIPRHCGSDSNSFIYASVHKREGRPINTRLKVVQVPHFGRYWKTDCSPSTYITGVADKSVNLRLILTTEYGQDFDSVADGECAKGVKEFVQDIEFALP